MASLCKHLGAAIRTARRNMGYTQDQLGERLDLTANFIAHLERGSRRPSLDTLLALSLALQVPLRDLFAGIPRAGGPSAAQGNPLLRRLHRFGRELSRHDLHLLVQFLETMHRRARS